jgi:cell division septum initiation protein DivIVA
MERAAGELGLEGGGAGADKESRKRRGKNGHDSADVAGRKDQSGQEGVIDKTALVKGMPKAIKIERDLADAKADASAFYKTFAESTNLNAATLRSAAKAYANDKEEAAKRKAEQTTLILEECGPSGE